MKTSLEYITVFSDQEIMVIGDLIADEFITGQPERLSREAPVLILRHQNREILPGGGANAASNILSLGGKVKLVGIVGDDQPGCSLINILKKKGMNIKGILKDNNRPTTVKTRIIAGGYQMVKQQVVRIDNLDSTSILKEFEDRLLDFINEEILSVDGLLLSDYGNGVFTERMRKEIISLGRRRDKFVVVDSRYNLLDYSGATIATPNLEEAANALNRKISKKKEVVQAGRELISRLRIDYLIITQGGDGMTLFDAEGKYYHIPAVNYTEVFDVTGAGDTVVGTLCLALGAGADVYTAMKLANYAAGIVIRKSGVATLEPVELRREVIKNEG